MINLLYEMKDPTMPEGLSSGETVIMDSGRWPTSYAKSLMVTVNGRLCLTNMRMIFLPSRFQSFTALLRKEEKDVIQIPLNRITEVEKGFISTIKIHADKEYTFKGMREPDKWVSAINQARTSVLARVITKYKQQPSGEIVELGPVQLEQALQEIEQLKVVSISEGIPVPMLGFQDEKGAFVEFYNVDGTIWNVTVGQRWIPSLGEHLIGDVSLEEAKKFLNDFFRGGEFRLKGRLRKF